MSLIKVKIILSFLFITILLLSDQIHAIDEKNSVLFRRDINFNNNWKFMRCEASDDMSDKYKEINYNDDAWEKVTLPHTPRIEPLVVNDQWQGICWYRKSFTLEETYKGKKIYLEFEVAMQIADVWINGNYETTHYGGYLPFTIDITDNIFYDKKNIISIRLDNRDNPEVPPGKPLKELDFCMYGGLYRNVK
ncbi:MAG: beta-galactosidase, partial [bacterium]